MPDKQSVGWMCRDRAFWIFYVCAPGVPTLPIRPSGVATKSPRRTGSARWPLTADGFGMSGTLRGGQKNPSPQKGLQVFQQPLRARVQLLPGNDLRYAIDGDQQLRHAA